jgi:hypothetical protein
MVGRIGYGYFTFCCDKKKNIRIRYASSTDIFGTYIEDMQMVLEFNLVFFHLMSP